MVTAKGMTTENAGFGLLLSLLNVQLLCVDRHANDLYLILD